MKKQDKIFYVCAIIGVALMVVGALSPEIFGNPFVAVFCIPFGFIIMFGAYKLLIEPE